MTNLNSRNPSVSLNVKPLILTCLSLFGLALAQSAQSADSAKLLWTGNGHYYQRFERGSTAWPAAKSACEGLGAHLATITSQEEQGFIQSQLLANIADSNNWYSIGGTDASSQYQWKWITGESWNYTNWNAGQYVEPSSLAGEDYLAINGGYDPYGNNYGEATWWDQYSSELLTGYICEWSGNNYISTELVPDFNGNGVDEVASLYVDYKTGKHTVEIKDPLTDKVVSTLTFSNGFANQPAGMVVINDINGNHKPEIAVLYSKNNLPHVTIKDVTNNSVVLRDIDFLTTAYKPKAIGLGRDRNGNGANELVVIGVSKTTLKAMAEVRDSKSGVKSNNTPF